MWEGVQQHRGALKLPENGQEGAIAGERHEVEKTEKESVAFRRGLVEGVS